MAEEIDRESKTEEATPRRREEARRQGQIPFSSELSGSLLLLAGFVGLVSLGGSMGSSLLQVFRDDLPRLLYRDLDASAMQELALRVLTRFLTIIGPFLGLLLAVGVGASILQVGFQINTEKLELNFERLNPASGLKRLFSMSALVKGLFSILKLIAIATIAALVLQARVGVIASLNQHRLPGAAEAAWDLTMRLAINTVALLAIIGVLDYVYQRRRFEASLRMTKQEVKEELRHEEGDPQIKARIRQLQRERAKRKMLAEVPKATVVITNPTHIAVALRYEQGKDDAPIVVARGSGFVARRIAELARASAVPIVERPTLARTLYRGVREGQAIPGPLFRLVAEVIAFVYRLRGVSSIPTPIT